jgi:hypothetical protein
MESLTVEDEKKGYTTLSFYEVAALEHLSGIKPDSIGFADPKHETFVYIYNSTDNFPPYDKVKDYIQFGKVMARQRYERRQITESFEKGQKNESN